MGKKMITIDVETFEATLSKFEQNFQNNVLNAIRTVLHEKKTSKHNIKLVKAFEWAHKNDLIENLRIVLVGAGIIEDGEPEVFAKAFTGEDIKENDGPMIVWLPHLKMGPNKVELFYFLDALGKRNLIKNVIPNRGEAHDLYKKIERVIIDVNGNPIKNLKQSFNSFIKRKEKKLPAKAMKEFVKNEKYEIRQKLQVDIIKGIIKHKKGVSEAVKELSKYIKSSEDLNEIKYDIILSVVLNEQKQ
jgi:hypothetical protein